MTWSISKFWMCFILKDTFWWPIYLEHLLITFYSDPLWLRACSGPSMATSWSPIFLCISRVVSYYNLLLIHHVFNHETFITFKGPSPVFAFRGNRQACRRVKYGVKYTSTEVPPHPNRGLLVRRWEKGFNRMGFPHGKLRSAPEKWCVYSQFPLLAWDSRVWVIMPKRGDTCCHKLKKKNLWTILKGS